MSDGLTTQERIDKEYDEIGTAEWQPEETPEEGEPVKVAEPEPEPPKEDPLVAELREEQRKTQARYETLQGMIAKQNEELKQLRDMKSEPAPKAETPDVEDKDISLITEEYGESLARVIKNVKEETLSSSKKELNELREELNKTKEQTGHLEQERAITAEQRYYATLEKEVPEWKQLNGFKAEGIEQDPGFTKFLSQPVPLHDYTYNDLLLHHHSQGNAVKVAEIFKMAKGNKTEPQAKPVNQLEQLIEPEKTGRGTAPPPSTTKRTFTRAEINKFDNDYMMYQSGRLAANPEKIEARWTEIQDAIADGRVKD